MSHSEGRRPEQKQAGLAKREAQRPRGGQEPRTFQSSQGAAWQGVKEAPVVPEKAGRAARGQADGH